MRGEADDGVGDTVSDGVGDTVSDGVGDTVSDGVECVWKQIRRIDQVRDLPQGSFLFEIEHLQSCYLSCLVAVSFAGLTPTFLL